MSQVDDWSDGYTSDYLRDLNTYGPASANVPRSSVVSHRVQYRAPDTSDIPLAPGQNPEDSVYSNASGARMGQLKPRSEYNPPAGGGYTAQTFPSSGAGAKRYARPKKQTQVSKPAGKTQSAASAKRQVQNYGSYRDLSDPMSQRILANGSPEPKPPVESAVSRAQDITDQSDMYRAIAGLSSPPSANDSQSEVRTAGGINPFESAESLAAWKQAKLRAFPLTYSDFSGGAPNAEVNRFRTIALDPNSTVADVLTAENEAYKSAAVEKVDTDNFGLIESLALPVPGVPAGYAIKAAAEGRRLYGPVVERLLAPRGSLTGGARTTLTSADEGLPVGYSLLRESPKGTSAWRGAAADYGVSPAGGSVKLDLNGMPGAAGREVAAAGGQAADWTSNLAQQLRAAGIPEDQIAASIARINAEAAGREAAAAGREAAAAGGQAAGREAAAGAGRAGEAAADGGVSELANAGNAGRETAAGGAAARQGAGEAAGAGGQAAGRGAAPAAEAGGQAPVDRLAALPDWAMGQVPTSQLQAMIEAAIQNDPIARSVFSKIAFAKHGSVALDSFLSRGLSKFFNREDLITIGNAINRARKTGGVND